MRKFVNILCSVGIIFLVSGASLTMAANPAKLLSRNDSNLTWFKSTNACASEVALNDMVEMVLDNDFVNSAQSKDLARQMTDEAISRHVRVSSISGNEQNDCKILHISKIDARDLPSIVDTYDFKNETLSDFVEVINTCKTNVIKTGKCILITRPGDFMTDNKPDADKYSYFLQIIKGLTNG